MLSSGPHVLRRSKVKLELNEYVIRKIFSRRKGPNWISKSPHHLGINTASMLAKLDKRMIFSYEPNILI